MKSKSCNQTIDTLKQYFPQAVGWFPAKDSRILCRFMTRWPTLQQVRIPAKANTGGYWAIGIILIRTRLLTVNKETISLVLSSYNNIQE